MVYQVHRKFCSIQVSMDARRSGLSAVAGHHLPIEMPA